MIYFIMGIVVVLSWVLFKRIIMTGAFLAIACAVYFYETDNKISSLGGLGLSANIRNNLGRVQNLVDQEAQTVFSFYSTLSDKQGNIVDKLAQLSNGGGQIK